MPKVLVVDEHPGVKTLVGAALEGKRVEVLAAESGAQAVERIERERPDLVICDVYMPDVDGYRICDFVRKHPDLRSTPVLLMSEIVDRAVIARAERVRSDDVLRKPCGAAELVTRIEGLLDALGTAGVGVTPSPSAPDDLADAPTLLTALADLSGVNFAALVDSEGFLVDWVGGMELDAEMVAALASSLAESSEGVSRELGRGTLQNMIFEYDKGLVLMTAAEPTLRLVVVLSDPAALEQVRRAVKRFDPLRLPASNNLR
ncbi:MAG TPA: response regulator [Candidatus Methylomirabilis sp.]|nr:response regulator [Candidatus Methylomirabilis sp.]